jgi:hypothetical protein
LNLVLACLQLVGTFGDSRTILRTKVKDIASPSAVEHAIQLKEMTNSYRRESSGGKVDLGFGHVHDNSKLVHLLAAHQELGTMSAD